MSCASSSPAFPDGAKTVQSLDFNEFVDTSFLKRTEQEDVGGRR